MPALGVISAWTVGGTVAGIFSSLADPVAAQGAAIDRGVDTDAVAARVRCAYG